MKTYKASTLTKALVFALRSNDFFWNQYSYNNYLILNSSSYNKIKKESYYSYDWAFDFRHGNVFKINDKLNDGVVQVDQCGESDIKLQLSLKED